MNWIVPVVAATAVVVIVPITCLVSIARVMNLRTRWTRGYATMIVAASIIMMDISLVMPPVLKEAISHIKGTNSDSKIPVLPLTLAGTGLALITGGIVLVILCIGRKKYTYSDRTSYHDVPTQ